jgi:HEAT repeat protein
MSANQVKDLIEILFDRSASLAERDDAAMYLGEINDEEALQGLLKFAYRDFVSVNNDEVSLKATCGESIGYIWLMRGKFDRAIYDKLSKEAQREIKGLFVLEDPNAIRDLITEFDLNITEPLHKKQLELLIDWLYFKGLETEKKEQAILQIGQFDQLAAINALIEFASFNKDLSKSSDKLLVKCGESIANIWLRNGGFDQSIFNSLPREAQKGVRNIFKLNRPDLL